MRARKKMKQGKVNMERIGGEICMRVCPEMGKEGEQEKGGDKGRLENKISRITKKVQSSQFHLSLCIAKVRMLYLHTLLIYYLFVLLSVCTLVFVICYSTMVQRAFYQLLLKKEAHCIVT